MEFRQTAFILILILALQVFLRVPFLDVPLDRDEGAYGYMAQRILAGEIPYWDAFDHKPPLIYYTYAGLVKVFGNTVAAIRYPTLLYSLLTTAALFFLGYVLWGAWAGLVSALLYAIFSGGVLISGFGSNTENFMVLPMILAFTFFVKGQDEREEGVWFFLAGLFSGVAIMFKQVALCNLAALLLFMFSFEDGWPRFYFSHTLRLLFGALLVPLAFVVYFASKGALTYFYHDVIAVNASYVSILEGNFIGRMNFGFMNTLFQASNENALIWLLAALGSLYILLAGRVRENLALLLWGLGCFAGALASGLFFSHYYVQVVPVLCLLSGYALDKVSRGGGWFLKGAVAAAVIILTLNVLPFQYPYFCRYTPLEISANQHGKNNYVVSYLLAKELKKHMKPDETILVWSANPELYYYLGKKSPTRYYNYLDWMETPEVKEEIIAAVLKAEPDWLAWAAYAVPYREIAELVKSRYTPVFLVDKWRVYKKRP